MTLFRNRLINWSKNVFTLIGGFVVAFALAEIGTRLWLPQHFPVHPPGMYREDPRTGYALTPDFQGVLERPEFRASFSTNSEGLRGGPLRPAGPNSYRIMVLGDSMAFGFGVGDAETFAFQLEQILQADNPGRDIQVLNYSVPGYGSADQLNTLRAHIEDIEPQLIIVQFFSVNDLAENEASAAEWARVADGMLTAAADGPDPNQGLARTDLWLQRLKSTSQFISLASNQTGYWLSRQLATSGQQSLWGESFTAQQAELGTRILVDIANVASAHDSATLLLYSTGQAPVIADNYVALPSRAVVAAAAERSGATWVDSAALLQASPDRLSYFYKQDGHWTAAGHRAIAELLAAELAPLP